MCKPFTIDSSHHVISRNLISRGRAVSHDPMGNRETADYDIGTNPTNDWAYVTNNLNQYTDITETVPNGNKRLIGASCR